MKEGDIGEEEREGQLKEERRRIGIEKKDGQFCHLQVGVGRM